MSAQTLSNEFAMQLFSDISDYIASSMALLEKGEVENLSGLDQKIQHLCETIVHLSESDRLLYAEKLEQLNIDLLHLSDAMHRHKATITAEINKTSNVRKASIAYKTADARDDFGKKNEQ